MEDTMGSVAMEGAPPQVVLEALEGYSILIQEVYMEASSGVHWAGVPRWTDYLVAYLVAESENRTKVANADMQDFPQW